MLSERQYEQRRKNGVALAQRVDRDFYRFIGRRGGRRFMLNTILQNAENLICPACKGGYCKLAKVNPAGHQRQLEELREYYRQSAFEKYHDFTGNRIMIELFTRS